MFLSAAKSILNVIAWRPSNLSKWVFVVVVNNGFSLSSPTSYFVMIHIDIVLATQDCFPPLNSFDTDRY